MSLNMYLKNHWLGATIGFVSVVLLGVVSSGTFALIGPTIQILIQENNQNTIDLTRLLGEQLTRYAGLFGLVTSGTRPELLKRLCEFILIFALSRAILTQLHWSIWEIISEKVAQNIRSQVAASLLSRKPWSQDAKGIEDKFASIIGTDLRIAREYIVHFYGGLPRELSQIAFYTFTLWLLSPTLFLVFFFGVIPVGLIISKIGKQLKVRSSKVLDGYSDLMEWIQLRFLGVETIKHIRSEQYECTQFGVMNADLMKKAYSATRVKSRTSPILEFAAIVAFVSVIYIALDLLRQNAINGSIIMSFFATLAILAQSTGKIGRYYNSNKEGQVAWKRIVEGLSSLRQEYEENYEIARKPLQLSAVTLESVSFGYDPNESDVISNLTLSLKKSKITCIGGASGSGKTTLTKLVVGLLRPTRGTIYLDEGINLKSDFAYMPQSVQSLPGSIASLVAYPDIEPDMEQVKHCLQKVQLLDVVNELPEQLNTVSEDFSERLSGGQVQRLFLARIFYRQYKIIVLDESTSALDPISELIFLNSLREIAQKGCCIVAIAHRPAILEIADDIFILKKGKVVAAGSPEEVRQSIEYQDVWGVLK